MAKLRIGEPDVRPDLPSHVPGVYQGNARGNYEKNVGWLPDGRVTAERSTGVDAQARNPIDPRMPNLPPA
jgi:hypothetical protein